MTVHILAPYALLSFRYFYVIPYLLLVLRGLLSDQQLGALYTSYSPWNCDEEVEMTSYFSMGHADGYRHT